MELGQERDLTHTFYPLGQIDFFLIFLILLFAFALSFLIQKLFPWVAEKTPGIFRFYILPLVPILRLMILAITILLVAPLIIKPTFQNLVAIFGAAAVALGFALKDYVSSLVAGVVALYEQPYRPGDWVKIDEAYGEVKSLGLRCLKMVTPDDTLVTIPHGKIWSTNVYNSNAGRREHLCVADFYLHPEHDASQVRQKLVDVVLTSAYLQIRRPVTVVLSETPWGTHYRLKAYPIDGRDQFQFISDLTVRGKAALSEMNVRAVSVPFLYDTEGCEG
jgi:small conductance mechanosensitive channel